jgi:hypothetical protein
VPSIGTSVAGRGLALGYCVAHRARVPRHQPITARFGTLAELDTSSDEAERNATASIEGDTLRVVWPDGYTHSLYVQAFYLNALFVPDASFRWWAIRA